MTTRQVILVAAVTLAATATAPASIAVQLSGARGVGIVIVAAGDITCEGGPCRGDRRTADRIAEIDPAAVLPLGDLQYPSGSLADYERSYDRSWGRFLDRSFPVPGNHEYLTPGAAGYFGYFGTHARGPEGWYSFDMGGWHLIALNSRAGGTPSDAQLDWLSADLRNDGHVCELAYWHEPRFSSGVVHGSNRRMRGFWNRLFDDGAELVLNGHEHNYERFRPMLPSGSPSPTGIREFVVGTGGYSADYPFRARPLATSRRRLHRLGVLRLTLRPDGYDWAFVRPGGAILDDGTGTCHP
jgi:hypothetical protein